MDDDVELVGAARDSSGDLLPCVGSRDVETERRSADLVRHLAQRVAGRRDVDGDDVGAGASEHARDLGADATGGTGDDGDLAGHRAVPVGHLGHAVLAQTHRLARDVGRTARQEEAQRRFEHCGVTLGVRVDPQQVGRSARAQLLADRARDAFEGLRRGGGLDAVELARRRCHDDDAGRLAESLDGRDGERAELLEIGERRRGGGVDDERPELVGVRGVGRRVDHGAVRRPNDRGGRRAHDAGADDADRGGAVEQGLARLVATQHGRLRQPDLLGELLAEAVVDEVRVTVSHHTASRIATTP